MQSHTEATLCEGIVWLLHGATADIVQYLGPQALVAEIINTFWNLYMAPWHPLIFCCKIFVSNNRVRWRR